MYAIIIGAGPAGLTAALELKRRSRIDPIVLEASDEIGGLSRTVHYKGNRMDIGGHRFFSKSDRVMQWWLELMPLENRQDGQPRPTIHYRNQQRTLPEITVAPSDADLVMLVRPRKSRIYFSRKFFDYPIALTPATLRKLGITRAARVGISYLSSCLAPRRPERTLEDFFINRFGRELYLTFFKSYTEKVWGISCHEITAEWGIQRIKGLSLRKAVAHFLKSILRRGQRDVAQRNTETSLIDQFLYPKYGPGQLWEHVAELVTRDGGQVLTGWRVARLCTKGASVVAVEAVNRRGECQRFPADYVLSTMPVRDLVRSLDLPVPGHLRKISEGLVYRDFITVGLLVKKLVLTESDGTLLHDTWIYIQEPDVLVGRLQIFNNWSPYLVADPSKVWIGLEYFCNEPDDIWQMQDGDLLRFAASEAEKIGILHHADILDGLVVRVPKTYPAYFGTYQQFDTLREWLDKITNLFLIGRNGMHKYNNQDHSMLTAMCAVDNILAGITDKANLWAINTEQEYQEQRGG